MKRLLMSTVVAAMLITTGSMRAQNTRTAKDNSAKVETVQQKKFKQIKVNQVPDAVTDVIDKKLKNTKIAEAYVSGKETYKLKLKMKGQKALKTVYFNKDGKMMKMDKTRAKSLKATNRTH